MSDCKELVGVNWLVSDCEELLGLLIGNEDCLQRLTERTFYGVSTLSRFSTSENFFRIARRQRKSFTERIGVV